MGQAARKAVGSRGGQVVSYTRAGHPVYATEHAKYANALRHHDNLGGDPHEGAREVHAAHPHFSADDHLHAADTHSVRANNGEGHKGHSNFLAESHALASIAVRRHGHLSPRKAIRQANNFFKAVGIAFKADMQDADQVAPEQARRMGLQTKADLPPDFDPDRDPNGTREIPGGYWEGRAQAMCYDDGLADYIIASVRAEKSYQKPSRSEYMKAPTYRRAKFVGE